MISSTIICTASSAIRSPKWNTNCNLMQLLSGRFTFQQQITQHNKAQIGEMTQISYENVVEPLAVSPAVKRSIWQTVQIVQEIKQIKGIAPQKIFIEMARDDDSKGKKKGRKLQLVFHNALIMVNASPVSVSIPCIPFRKAFEKFPHPL